MSSAVRRAFLIVASILSLAPPAVGAYLRWGGMPPGFGVFPPQRPLGPDGAPLPVPGFDPLYFAVAASVAGLLTAFLVFPGWFGFQPATRVPRRAAARVRMPWWFWAGLVLNVCSWGMMWFSSEPVVKYLFTALWWGFIAVIDGIVYRRTGGASIFAKLPKQLAALVVMSIVGWFFFEWLNWFVLANWTYPNSPHIFTTREAYFWFTLTFTCVWPAIFEWYTLLRTFPALTERWARGPSLSLGKPLLVLLLLLGVGLGVLVGIFPYELFFVVWLGSLLMLPAAMGLLGYWTPFSPIAHGNWGPLTLIGLASLANGLFWEFWNHGTKAFNPGQNPNFWVYDIPYVNVIHLFSEMPLVGYFGYLPFGAQCWMWWLVAAHVLAFDPDFDPEHVGLVGERAATTVRSTPPPASGHGHSTPPLPAE